MTSVVLHWLKPRFTGTERTKRGREACRRSSDAYVWFSHRTICFQVRCFTIPGTRRSLIKAVLLTTEEQHMKSSSQPPPPGWSRSALRLLLPSPIKCLQDTRLSSLSIDLTQKRRGVCVYTGWNTKPSGTHVTPGGRKVTTCRSVWKHDGRMKVDNIGVETHLRKAAQQQQQQI